MKILLYSLVKRKSAHTFSIFLRGNLERLFQTGNESVLSTLSFKCLDQHLSAIFISLFGPLSNVPNSPTKISYV